MRSMKRTRDRVKNAGSAWPIPCGGACGARQTRKSRGGRSGPSVKKPTCETGTKKVGTVAGATDANVSVAVGSAAPMQQAAQALHLNLDSVPRSWAADDPSLAGALDAVVCSTSAVPIA